MRDKSWFDQWFKTLRETLAKWGEGLTAFIHQGVFVGCSERWRGWVAMVTATTCQFCTTANGKIVDPKDSSTLPRLNGAPVRPKAHPNCRCDILPLPTMRAGTATVQGEEGADWYFFHCGELPSYYLTKDEARDMGWDSKEGNLHEAIPGRMIGGDLFWNNEVKLPDAPGRVWHEADVNYTYGYRGRHRIYYSNDGLIFMSYDHFKTFIEIVP